jgi:hypothetical protein
MGKFAGGYLLILAFSTPSIPNYKVHTQIKIQTLQSIIYPTIFKIL